MQDIEQKIEEHHIREEPYYLPTANELAVSLAAYATGTPILLKGPTGCGKTRFMQYLAWKLKRPLITVSCHDDLSTGDLVGRYLIQAGEAVWHDGPLTMAVRRGAICYLDEIVEARKDTTVVIHPLADDRRELPVEKKGELLVAPPEFMLAVSYNPGYQSVLKDLKPSTRQRFLALDFDYPSLEREAEIVASEAGVESSLARSLVKLARMTRGLKDSGLVEGASTRLLIQAGKLVVQGIPIHSACRVAITQPLSDDPELLAALDEMVRSLF
ncbi:CbbQ/NirQ/NorQ/GpvN family protein [Desulfogranum mediterraneum]|uniref:CbbQ/NirQ/NorQ/GpvN family protein n=1 Tax=Desulfogranum mediterraneum TaxID=160661 RepID=UPI00040C0977|nr:CbbQ/NirQ/NorQ/GpvN family protein [Desulfogranum mediterraneum]